jgi:DNA mismatch repair protein MutS
MSLQPARDPSEIPGATAEVSPTRAVATPLLTQYLAIKAEHQDALLFYRLGDFYELFFGDAVAAAAALDIVLTRRGKHHGEDVPMCGVPAHAAETYIARLIKAGHKVAVCEQSEEAGPGKRRGVLGRGVVRVITPGTLTEDTLLDARQHNYLAALAGVRGDSQLALAWLDVSTGDFHLAPTDATRLAADLARIQPGELIVPDALLAQPDLFEAFLPLKPLLTPLPAARFDSQAGERRLKQVFAVAALDAFGCFGRAEIAAAGALIDYVDLTQKGRLPPLKPPVGLAFDAIMAIDAATRRNLELTAALDGDRAGSLLAAIDRTLTSAGARLLAERLAAPLTDPALIDARLDMLAYFIAEAATREKVRQSLRAMPDVQRALSRLLLGRGGPRDLAALRDGLAAAQDLRQSLGERPPVAGIAQAAQGLGYHAPLVDRLGRALAQQLPHLARDGGFIAPGYRPELDELRAMRDESRRLVAALQARYADETGVAALKIRHNNVLGYYAEVAPRFAEKLDQRFIHRQSLATAARYTTVELGELERKISQAAGQALALELELFDDLVGEAKARGPDIARACEAAAALDVAAGLAELAAAANWARPQVDASLAFSIRAGRHAAVEAALQREQGPPFVPNDCDLGPEQRLWLLTGPNMAGKSTFLRQNALIAVLAQMGSYVPAEAAHIGVVDRLFSRVGAADDLARGRSTFMVEMVETAAILHQATPRSLVVLDEIGRGTATFDGLSIAWATVEHLHQVNRSRALFATHFHELTALAEKLAALSNRTMLVKEWQGQVVFLHEVAPGAADRSYGIHVAKLAGLPAAVIARAEDVLRALEKTGQSGAVGKLADDLPLFSASVRPGAARQTESNEIERLLLAARLDDFTPRQALELLYRLKELSGGTKSTR